MLDIHKNTKADLARYFEDTVPEIEKLISLLNNFFEVFTTLSFDDWFPEIHRHINKARRLQKQCREIQAKNIIYGSIFKKRRNAVHKLIKEINDSSTRRLQNIIHLNQQASRERLYWILSYLNPFKSSEDRSHHYDEAQAARGKAEQERSMTRINEETVSVVTQTMVPGLESLSTAIDFIGGFFNNIEHKLQAYTEDDNGLEYEFRILRGKAAIVATECTKFHVCVHGVKSTILAIS